MLKYYIASKFQHKAREVRALLSNLPLISVARWIDAKDFAKEGRPPEVLRERAEEDLIDVRNADFLILITEAFGEYSTGGRHTEFGYMLALGRPVIIYGDEENVFHYMNEVERANSPEALLRLVKEMLGSPTGIYLR